MVCTAVAANGPLLCTMLSMERKCTAFHGLVRTDAIAMIGVSSYTAAAVAALHGSSVCTAVTTDDSLLGAALPLERKCTTFHGLMRTTAVAAVGISLCSAAAVAVLHNLLVCTAVVAHDTLLVVALPLGWKCAASHGPAQSVTVTTVCI